MRLSPTPTLPRLGEAKLRRERERERSGASVDVVRTKETLD